MDLLVNPTPENSARVSGALSQLQMQGFSDASFVKPALQVPLKQNFYAELLTPRTDGPLFSEIAASAVEAKLFGLAVRVASPASLIRLKQDALASAGVDRNKHLKDIEFLQHAA